MLFKFAFRNLMRKKKRTFITSLSIFFAAIVVMLGQGWVMGMFDMMTDNFVNNQTGNVRISTKEYDNREKFLPVNELMENHQKIIKKVEQIEGVEKIEERIRFRIMLGKGEKTVFAMGMGLDLNNNKFDLKDKITEGNLDANGIIIGQGLSEKINVEVGQKLLLATETSEGGLNGIKVPVSGIANMNMNTLNEKVFFISLDNARKLLKINDNQLTEIYIFTEDHDDSLRVKREISNFLPENIIALTYKEQLGSFMQFMEVEEKIIYFVFALIVFLASFVIVNTMIMAVFERLREIGTLRSIGFTSRQIFWNFTIEGALVGLFGGITGSLIGYLFVMYLNHVGIDVSTIAQGSDFPINYVIHPVYQFKFLLITAGMAIIIPAIASMFPARLTEKYTPAEMLRKV